MAFCGYTRSPRWPAPNGAYSPVYRRTWSSPRTVGASQSVFWPGLSCCSLRPGRPRAWAAASRHRSAGSRRPRLRSLARRLQGEAPENLPHLVSLIDDSLARLRSLSLDLRPPQLDYLGIAATLRDTLARVAEPAGIETRLVVQPEDIALEPGLATTVFRLAQEAIANAVRHAAPQRIVVELRAAHNALELAVSDDGKGFDLDAARARAIKGASVGLRGMEERATLAGGELKIITRPGQGTRVQARFSPGSGL